MTEASATSERVRTPMDVVPRKATKADSARLTAVMARAFDDDPLANWIALQDKRRASRIYEFMRLSADKFTLPFGDVWTTDNFDGGALWNPPGTWKLGVLQQLLLMPAMVKVAGWRRIPTVVKGINMVEKDHPATPHYYLLALGVEPELQGRGIGAQLMAPVLERCDREGTPAYLESSKEKNLPLYERNGFKVTKEIVLPGDGPKIWLMWRDPKK